ncbi:DNA polymerase II [Neptunomonas phycophila]|uniref:DNA polymerase II n=1 Tax=Neptunomonas phycophila TaxID=1572645 RepID=UPI0015BFE998|nr:DNA polymerase II [Neptunomonas phycophila]QLE98282.1 DNA polymerase II [Neptunomonas phycophila]
MTAVTVIRGFIIARHQQDQNHTLQLRYWVRHDAGVSLVSIDHQETVFFVCDENVDDIRLICRDLKGWRLKKLSLTDLNYKGVHGLYTRSLRIQREIIERLTRHAIAMMEEDIRPVDRYLMERFIFGGVEVFLQPGLPPKLRPTDYKPSLSVLSVDIETTMRADLIHSIGCYQAIYSPNSDASNPDAISSDSDGGVTQSCLLERVVLMRGVGNNTELIRYFPDERTLLKAWVELVKNIDPDLFIGWNVVGFDFKVLAQRAQALKVPLTIGRDQQPLQVVQSGQGKWYARIEGRNVLDGIDTLKNATFHFESYSLESVAQSLFKRGKLITHPNDRGEEIQRLYREDQPALARYNLEDCKLVWDIFVETRLIEYLIERTRLTGLSLDKVGGSAAAFDFQYLPRLHRHGYVGPEYASGASGLDAPGGFVMESLPGLYRNVLVLDFKSLYPSIIRTFKVDPCGLAEGLKASADDTGLVPGFNQAVFSQNPSILPTIIEELWAARDQAKKRENKPLSQAIKIIMNAFYGVLGSNVCRFFDQRLAGSITLRGHQILQQTRDEIEQAFGYQVIYGDTDSVFVLLDDACKEEEAADKGNELAVYLNAWWSEQVQSRFGIESHLELEYETHYSRFLMPRMRHSEKGSKKRYAGLLRSTNGDTHMVFKGLENVRSDWTPLARELQRTLYEAIFRDQPYKEYIQMLIKQLRASELDDQLVYRRRLRQPLSDYIRMKPPHVQAALKAEAEQSKYERPVLYQPGMHVSYIMTVNGPEPVEYRRSAIDYEHYIEKQIMPVVDGILCFLDDSFEALTSQQVDLFS